MVGCKCNVFRSSLCPGSLVLRSVCPGGLILKNMLWDLSKSHFTPNPLTAADVCCSVDGNTYGNCIVFPNGDYNCNSDGSIYRFGYRKFRCLTSFTADQLNSRLAMKKGT